ncbi:A/G-specific adenine glycosylase [Flavobacterium sp. GT3R68]|uniref:A/G-specific adenine glycosylase n=1 Tax=Flavobacterium sp. GT3R68 TaxID=2594437 RepID=UPI000F862388|nr:A/G-specific adenine glycosylase [Flavobacterium sp. GT3R68]RTY93997.1 A/G-specific adenine glycosylase [Flavobacterium sp. GSN2]TRW93389.1 A/G-specific adenine glycosylase [Flavobacterium sp. GT3R68]
MDFSNLLTRWYLQNKRDLPWRNTKNPYPIWLSEIMLQQTRVAQGLPYFLSFTEAFPTVFDLANASEEQVLKLWQGLGYYSRARNLHKTAQYVAFELNGIFPDNYNDLLKLKGIGEYTAAAIASFSYDEAVPVVDGNVFRVLSRFFDIDTDIAQASAKKEFAALAFELMLKDTRGGAELSEANPALFNQAIMEFGAMQCVPKNPNCDTCVMNSGCVALQKNKIHLLPLKSKKPKVRKRFFNYLIIEDDDKKALIQKRTDKGIWHNLYEFPLIETEEETIIEDLIEPIRDMVSENGISSVSEYNFKSQVHKLSHQHLHIKFWKVKINGTIKNGMDYETLKSHPFPIVIFNFIENDFLK